MYPSGLGKQAKFSPRSLHYDLQPLLANMQGFPAQFPLTLPTSHPWHRNIERCPNSFSTRRQET